ncbi:MAG: metallophosphoesterase, partial [Ruminococcus sp.]|nr:metallophosphoesterase [Ruminococcus sp.]
DDSIDSNHIKDGVVGGNHMKDGALDRLSLFSADMIAKYMSLHVYTRSVAGGITDAVYNSMTNEGIYKVDAMTGVHQVVIVLKPASDAYLMQIRLSYNKLEYRGIWCTEDGVYADEDWENWVDLTSGGSGGADGLTPYIGENGNWFIGDSDTGVKAQGEKGDTGATGEKGDDGYTPVKGVDYFTPADKAEITQEVVAELNPPDYVETEAASVVDRVMSALGNRTLIIACITDLHYGSYGYYEGVTDYSKGVKHACQALKYIDERIKLDAVAVLGDYTDGMAAEQYDTAVYDFKGVNSVLDKLRFVPNLRLQGNHDFVAEKSPAAYRYIGAYSDDAVVWGNCLGGYFYKDFEAQKLRVICLNTSELGNDSLACSAEQYQWFVNSLDMTSKSDASEWQILILSHIPLDYWAGSDGYKFAYILNAYQNGTSWSDDSVSCDFSSGNNRAKIVGNIHGHTHNLKTDKLYLGNIESSTEQINVWRMATPNACFGAENKEYTGYTEDNPYVKTANSAKDTAFCIYCIDLDTCTIKAICYGAGYDRELNYEDNSTSSNEPAYTNILDSVGYTADKRFSTSSGELRDNTGTLVTGQFAVSAGDTIYLKNVGLSDDITDAHESRVCSWKSDGTYNTYLQLNNTLSEEYGVVSVDGNITQFKVLESYLGDTTGTIAICASYIGTDSVITVNEPIV